MTYLNLAKVSVVFIVPIIVVAQFLSPKTYDWKVNTISELAAQGYARKAIMQTGFVVFGLLLSIGLIAHMVQLRRVDYGLLALVIYALAVGLSGIYCTKPFVEGVSYVELEQKMHSAFATIAGIAITAGIVIHFFTSSSIELKVIHFAFFLLVTLASLAFGLLPAIQGAIQRILYASGFAWIVIYLGRLS